MSNEQDNPGEMKHDDNVTQTNDNHKQTNSNSNSNSNSNNTKEV